MELSPNSQQSPTQPRRSGRRKSQVSTTNLEDYIIDESEDEENYLQSNQPMVLDSDDEEDKSYEELPPPLPRRRSTTKTARQNTNWGEDDDDPFYVADDEEVLLDIPDIAQSLGYDYDTRIPGEVNMENIQGHPILENILNVVNEADLWHLYFPSRLLQTWVKLTNAWFIDNHITKTRSNIIQFIY